MLDYTQSQHELNRESLNDEIVRLRSSNQPDPVICRSNHIAGTADASGGVPLAVEPGEEGASNTWSLSLGPGVQFISPAFVTTPTDGDYSKTSR